VQVFIVLHLTYNDIGNENFDGSPPIAKKVQASVGPRKSLVATSSFMISGVASGGEGCHPLIFDGLYVKA